MKKITYQSDPIVTNFRKTGGRFMIEKWALHAFWGNVFGVFNLLAEILGYPSGRSTISSWHASLNITFFSSKTKTLFVFSKRNTALETIDKGEATTSNWNGRTTK